MGGLSENTSDPPDLNEWIESQRTRDGAGANGNLGAFTVHRHSGGAWVHFVQPSFAQWCLQGLNGREVPGGASLRVRYSGILQDTSIPPPVRYVKRAPPNPAAKRPSPGGGASAASSSSKAAVNSTINIVGPPDGGDAKRVKADSGVDAAAKLNGNGGASSSSSSAGMAAASSTNGHASRVVPPPPGSRVVGAPPRPGGGVAPGGKPTWDAATMGTNADVLRLALSRLDIDVALGEILHFLTNDDRLPGRTRKAVQFLHGLREQMVLAEAQKSNPELFDCPFTTKKVESYTFKEVKQQYGDDFRDKFWPVFQAFNCVLPAHAPEESPPDTTPEAALKAFLPSGKGGT